MNEDEKFVVIQSKKFPKEAISSPLKSNYPNIPNSVSDLSDTSDFWINNSSLSTYCESKRKEKAKYQDLKYLGRKLRPNHSKDRYDTYLVEGTTCLVYEVKWRKSTSIPQSCTCKDYQMHKRPCKHIYFIQNRCEGEQEGHNNPVFCNDNGNNGESVRKLNISNQCDLVHVGSNKQNEWRNCTNRKETIRLEIQDCKPSTKRCCELCSRPIQNYIKLDHLCLQVHTECLSHWIKSNFLVE